MQYFKKYLSAGAPDKEVRKKWEGTIYVKQWAKT